MEIPFGRKVQAADLRLLQLPPHAVPKGSFTSIEKVAGRISTQPIYEGEIILPGRVAERGAAPWPRCSNRVCGQSLYASMMLLASPGSCFQVTGSMWFQASATAETGRSPLKPFCAT